MTNEEFQFLIGMKKIFLKSNIQLPENNENSSYELKSETTKDRFYLDIDRRGKIEFSKFKLQNRYLQTKQPLVRIDIDSPPHTNPDGTKTSRNHIHIYQETEFDTGNLPWAYDLSDFLEISLNGDYSFTHVFHKFCKYCSINSENINGVI